MSGYVALLISILLLFGAVALFFTGMQYNPFLSVMGVLCFILAIFFMKGLMIIQPNHSRVLNFFGKYVGTVKENGLFFIINPLYSSQKNESSFRRIFRDKTLKVNDKMEILLR